MPGTSNGAGGGQAAGWRGILSGLNLVNLNLSRWTPFEGVFLLCSTGPERPRI